MSASNATLKRRRDGGKLVYRRKLMDRMTLDGEWEQYEDYLFSTPNTEMETLETNLDVKGIYSDACIASLDWPATQSTAAEVRSTQDNPEDTCEVVTVKDERAIFYVVNGSPVTGEDDPQKFEDLGTTAEEVKDWEASEWEVFSADGVAVCPMEDANTTQDDS